MHCNEKNWQKLCFFLSKRGLDICSVATRLKENLSYEITERYPFIPFPLLTEISANLKSGVWVDLIVVESQTVLWARLSVYRSFGRRVGWSVCHNFWGREDSLPCSYRSSFLYLRMQTHKHKYTYCIYTYKQHMHVCITERKSSHKYSQY